MPCIWGQGRVCWGILKQHPPQKWSWLHGRFHPSPKNRIIYLRCCCSCCYCLYCSCVVVVVVCTSSESQSTDIYTWAAGCFGFHLDCCCQLGHDFAIEKCPYRHDVQFNVKLSTSYLSFILVFDLDMFLSFFSPWFFSIFTVRVFRPYYFS